MSVATFSVPLSATHPTLGPVLVVGLEAPKNDLDHGSVLMITTDGELQWARSTHVVIDMRYDWSKQEWVDVSGLPDDGAAEDHGGEAIPGYLSEPDGVSGGNPSDGQDGAAGSLDPGEAEDRS